jgi:regulator of replication initiation timing
LNLLDLLFIVVLKIFLKNGKSEMELIAKLISEVPAAGKYRAELDKLEAENELLKMENAELKKELSQFIDKWETLDGDAVKTLVYLSQRTVAHPGEIAHANAMNFQIVEMYLNFLVTHAYVHPPANGGKSGYDLSHKGRRYLHERGLLKI